MRIVLLNKVDLTISGQALNLNAYHFAKIKSKVGLFQSRKYECIEWCEADKLKTAPAVLIPKKEFSFLKLIFPEITELNKPFENDVDSIVWFGSSTLQREKHDPNHVVAHELKHTEQRFNNLKAIYKNQILDFVIHNYLSPTDIDANNFANMVTARSFDKNYDWVDKVDKLFKENINKIKLINEAILKGDKYIIVDGECFCELSFDQNKKNLFRYYIKKINQKKIKKG